MKRLISIFIAASVVLSATLMPVMPVAAQSSASLSIVPKKNYTIEPGESVDDTLVIRNLDRDVPLELSLRVIDFTHDGDGGTPKLMLGEDAPTTTWSLKPYLTLPMNVTVDPSSSKTIDMNIAIPAGHGAGSYYSAIVYSSGASEGGNVGLSASGVTLVFTQIPGEVKQDLKLEKFGAYRQANGNTKEGYKFFNTTQPEMIAYTLKNSGNVTESPVGNITLRDMFGRTREIDNVNPNGSLALIGQTRTYKACIQLKEDEVDFNGRATTAKECDTPGLWPGYYRASLDLFYGQNGNNTEEINGSASFWYLPFWFLIVVILLLSVAGIYIWRMVNKFKGRKRGGRSIKSFRR